MCPHQRTESVDIPGLRYDLDCRLLCRLSFVAAFRVGKPVVEPRSMKLAETFSTVNRLMASIAAMAALAASSVLAEGHGPAFALATPTLGKGQWSSDTSVMSMATDEATAYTYREMIGYGIHEDLQAILTVPLGRSGESVMRTPRTRAGTMMGSGRDVEASLLWRFDREAPAIGTRRESSVIFGVAAPTEERLARTKVGTSTHVGVVTGFESRETYWWLGGGYQHYFEKDRDRLGDLYYVSAAFAWRPPVFRQDYPKPDWRIFVEALAEHSQRNKIEGEDDPNSGGNKLLLGPSVLGLSGSWGVSAGVLFPVAQDLGGDDDRFEERYRAKLVLTYWF
jgi:hypothetical protein